MQDTFLVKKTGSPSAAWRRYLWRGMIIFLTLTASCSAPQPSFPMLRFALANAPLNLDPRFATDAVATRINRLLYLPLVDFDAHARPVPALAQWKILTPQHYRFMLRADRPTFADGRTLTAQDVRATYASVLDPTTASPHRLSLLVIAALSVVNADTIDFHLHHPDPLFPGRLVLGIVPMRALQQGHALHRAPLGNGPFRFVAWPEEGRLILERRHDGRRVAFMHVADPTMRALKLRRGEVDMAQNDLPPEVVDLLSTQSALTVQRVAGSNYTYLAFNLTDPHLAQLVVRRAIAHALDREAIITYLFRGAARPAQALFAPPHWASLPLPPDHKPGYAYDPARARALLKSAGFGPHRPLKLSYKTSGDPFRVRLATVLQSQLSAVGIEVTLQSYDWGTLFGDIKAGHFQLYALSWVGIKTPDIFRYAFHSASFPPQGANRGRYRDADTDQLIEIADHRAQAVDYHAVQQRLLSELPVVPLWFEDQVAVWRQGVNGYQLAADGNYDGLITATW